MNGESPVTGAPTRFTPSFPQPADPDKSRAIARIRQLVTLAYLAVTDACDEGYAPDFEAAGAPLAEALELLKAEDAA